MSKHDDALQLLKTSDGESLSNRDIAARLGCDEGTVRRARKILEADRLSDQSMQHIATSDSGSKELLHAILEADQAEELARQAWEEAKDEVKELKEKLQGFVDARTAAGRAARENFPLWEPTGTKGTDGTPRLAMA